MCNQPFYNFLSKIAEESLKTIGLRNLDGGLKPLNIEDVVWQKGELGIYDPITLYGYRLKGKESLKVYSGIYIGLAAREDIDYLFLIRDILKSLNLKPLVLGHFNIEDVRRRRLYNVSNIGIYIDDGCEGRNKILNISFDIGGEGIVIVDRFNAIKLLLYVVRPMISFLGYAPLTFLPLFTVKNDFFDDGIYLLDGELAEASYITDITYIGVAVGNTLYLEDLRGVTIFRNKS